MSQVLEKFNIKTFPSETLFFENGLFCKKLSDYKDIIIKKNNIFIKKESKLPIHIIYIGEITGKNDLNIDIESKKIKVIISCKIKNKTPAFLNIFVKNSGIKSILEGKIICQNYKNLTINTTAEHLCKNTGIFIKTKILAHKNSITNLKGSAIIEKNIKNCDSDISFSVMADKTAKISILPAQYIKSIPNIASHSASLYKFKDNQINYLYSSGISEKETKKILEEAFLSE